jgi:polyphosphate kinase
MTGYAHPAKLKRLNVSPLNMRKSLIENIETEIHNAQNG